MWAQFEKVVVARGPSTIKVSKVKGHATIAMCESGEVSWEDRYNNNKADEAADHGVTVMQKVLAMTAKAYNDKHKRYIQFMSRIHKYIIEVRTKEAEMRKEKHKNEDPMVPNPKM